MTTFHNGGWTRYADLYFADDLMTLEPGAYELILKRTGVSDPLTPRGAMVTLTRVQATGPEFGHFALELFGYGMLGVACLAAWRLKRALVVRGVSDE
jgi:hypothetical protein